MLRASTGDAGNALSKSQQWYVSGFPACGCDKWATLASTVGLLRTCCLRLRQMGNVVASDKREAGDGRGGQCAAFERQRRCSCRAGSGGSLRKVV